MSKRSTRFAVIFTKKQEKALIILYSIYHLNLIWNYMLLHRKNGGRTCWKRERLQVGQLQGLHLWPWNMWASEVRPNSAFHTVLPETGTHRDLCRRSLLIADILGSCDEDNGESWATFCNKAFKLPPSFTMSNADVLCMTTVARREMIITRVDGVTSSNVQTKPWAVLTGIHSLFLVNIPAYSIWL